MARGGWLKLGLFLWIYSASVIKSDILPFTPDGGDPTMTTDNILGSLNHLKETLLDEQTCEGRMQRMWEAMGRRTRFLKDNTELLHKALNDWSRLAPRKVEECAERFTKAGDVCYHIYEGHEWPWWRARFYCEILGGEMVYPRDLHLFKDSLPQTGDKKFWIGARTSPELEFPDWRSNDGHRVWSDRENYTTIPRPSREANCLAIDGSNSYEIQPLDCEGKVYSLCQQKLIGCPAPYEKVGQLCLSFQQKPSSWVKARHTCSKNDEGYLASPNDFDSMQEYLTRKSGSTDWKAWTGGRMRTSKYIYKWLDDTNVDPVSWQNHDNSTQGHCLALTGGEYSSANVECNVNLPYICQKDIY